MALFWLINLRLVTFSSSPGCQGDDLSPVESFPGQLCPVPVLVVSPSQAAPLGAVKHQQCSVVLCCRGNAPLPTGTNPAGSWAVNLGKWGQIFIICAQQYLPPSVCCKPTGLHRPKLRGLFLHSSMFPYETTLHQKAKQRKKKHPGKKKPPSVLEGCVIYSNSLCSFIKPSLTQKCLLKDRRV